MVGEYCGSCRAGRPRPARLAEVLRQEERPTTPLLARAWKTSRRIDLRDFDPDDELIADLAIDRVPAGATLLDLRSREEFAEWHPADALRLELADALRAYPSFAKEREYVVYCAYGLKSAHLAELMCESGLRAHHFRGGARALKKVTAS